MGKVTSVVELVVDGMKAGRERLQRARDTNYTTDTYHGSTHDLTEMDASKTNIEGDWGKGIYSSNNIDDVNENYAGVGSDLTARIEQQRERLQDDILDEIQTNGLETTLQRYSELLNDDASTKSINDIEKYRDNDEGFAKDLADIVARKQIKGSNDGVVYPLKQNTEGFATIGGKDRTIVEGRDYHAEAREEIQRSDYDDEYDYEDAVEEYAFDLMNSDYDTNYQKVLEVIDRRGGGVSVDDLADAFDGDSVDLTKLDEIIRESQIYAEDDAGNFIPNGAVSAEILQNLGFKGVIDNTANTKFGSARDRGRPMDGMDEDTVHYITFEGAENQIRSRNAQFKDPTSRNLLAGSAATAITLPAMFGSSETQAGFFSQAVKYAPNIVRKKGDAQSFWNELTGKGQVKPDELNYMGFKEHFGDRTDITKEEVQQLINDNQLQLNEIMHGMPDDLSKEELLSWAEENDFDMYSSLISAPDEVVDDWLLEYSNDMYKNAVGDKTKFIGYTLDNGDVGTNYREGILQLPAREGLESELSSRRSYLDNIDRTAMDLEEKKREALEAHRVGELSLDELVDFNLQTDRTLLDLNNNIKEQKSAIKTLQKEMFVNSSHMEDINSLSHFRLIDRVDEEGKKVLLIEEIQDDWSKHGNRHGYIPDAETVAQAEKRLEDAREQAAQSGDMMYDFLTENGIDMEAENLNTDLYTDLIDSKEGSKIQEKQSEALIDFEFERTKLAKLKESQFLGAPERPFKVGDKRDTKQNSPSYELALKKILMEAVEGGYDKVALTKGVDQSKRYADTKGLIPLYDNTYVGKLNKMVRQDGTQVKDDVVVGTQQPFKIVGDPEELLEFKRLSDAYDDPLVNFDATQEARLNELKKKYAPTDPYRNEVHSIDVTDAMRERVKKGLPLFAQGGLAVGGGALFAPKDLQAAEYNEAPVIEEQSFGDMVSEYGQINRNLKALDDQRFARTIAEREARRGMSRRERRDNPPSEALRNLTMQEMKPSLGSIAQGVVEGNAQGLDYFHPLNIGKMILNPANEGLGRFIAPSIVNTYENAVSPVAKPVLFDERDPQAEEKSRSGKNFGNFFSLF